MAQACKSIFPLLARSATLLRVSQHHAANVPARYYKKGLPKVMKSLWKRRVAEGPPKERHRSEWINWNRKSEIFAFGKRLGEDFNESSLEEAFTDRTYVDQQKDKISDLGLEEPPEMADNSTLAASGEKLASAYIRAFLRHSHPALPEEGICSISDYLMSDEVLSSVGRYVGIKDLILCDELHPSDSVVSNSFKAVIGALTNDQGEERARLFVQDIVITQLIGKDINELWDIVNPMGLLEGVLAKEGRGAPEPRLLGTTGSETVEASFMVGIYSDKTLIAKSYGETATIAEEMAARAALRKYFGTTEYRPQYPFGEAGRQLKLDLNKRNTSILEYMKHAQLQ